MTSTIASSAAPSVLWSTPAPSMYGERRSVRNSVTKAYNPDWKLYVGFAGLCILAFASALDATVLVAGLPIIISKLDGNAVSAIWISSSYHLASSIVQPLFVSVSFICGRKSLLGASAALAIVGCVICAVAPNAVVFVVGRALQGAGGGASNALAEVIVSDLIPAEFRPRWLMIMNVIWALGTTIGPLIGAALVGTNIWKLVFYLNIGLHLTGGGLSILLTIDLRLPRSMGKALAMFDWKGVVLFITASVPLSMAIILGGVVLPWSSWQLILLLVTGSTNTVFFIVLECFYIRVPFIDLWRLKDVTGLTTFLCTWLHGFLFWSLISYLPIYYQSVKDLTPISSALALLPNTASIIPAFVLISLLISRTAKYKLIIFVSWALACLGAGLLALLDTGTTTAMWLIVNMLAGIGLGMIFSALVFSSQATAAALKQDFAFGSSMLHFFRSWGGSVGTAASGTIFQHEFLARISSVPTLLPLAKKYTSKAFHFAINLPKDLTTDEEAGFTQAYAYGLKNIWLMLGIAAIMGTITCVFAKEYGEHVYSRVRDDKEERGNVRDGKSRGNSMGTLEVISRPSVADSQEMGSRTVVSSRPSAAESEDMGIARR